MDIQEEKAKTKEKWEEFLRFGGSVVVFAFILFRFMSKG